MINDINDPDERPRDGDYRTDDEKPQIVQLNASDLSKEEVELELAKAREGTASERTPCASARIHQQSRASVFHSD